MEPEVGVVEATHEKVKALRAEKADIITEFGLKKVMIGGYDCKEVEEYILALKGDIVQSEIVFNEKLEEYSAASEMHQRERDKLMYKLHEKEKNEAAYKAETLKIIERNETQIKNLSEENEALKNTVSGLQYQIDNNEKNKMLEEEIQQIIAQNRHLNGEISKLTDLKNKAVSEKVLLSSEIENIKGNIQRLKSENEEYKQTINTLRLSNRNIIMETNMKIFEYNQNQQVSINSLGGSVDSIINQIEKMKEDLLGLVEKTSLGNESVSANLGPL